MLTVSNAAILLTYRALKADYIFSIRDVNQKKHLLCAVDKAVQSNGNLKFLTEEYAIRELRNQAHNSIINTRMHSSLDGYQK